MQIVNAAGTYNTAVDLQSICGGLTFILWSSANDELYVENTRTSHPSLLTTIKIVNFNEYYFIPQI